MFATIVLTVALVTLTALVVAAILRQSVRWRTQLRTRIQRVLPIGLQEKLGLHHPAVEWKPSPEAQYRANLWAVVCSQMRGALRRERRSVFHEMLRADFRHRSNQVTDETRAQRRRIIRAR